ncbi:MAG: 30S ribosome-binding factor RbfA [Albidovulum sp.]|uniref:30S ribosome-binding factor RbfA n=1 Tax=Albidovulum sp. TaxID=1872424 RepID=UPI003CC282ED
MATNRFSSGSGPTQRQLRVGELMRRTLSEVLQRGDVHNDVLRAMSITVGEVRVSADLRVATVYVLPLGGKDADEAMVALNRSKGELRHHVGKAMKLKFAPELRFMLDETFDRMDETRRLLSDERVQRDIAKPDDEDDDQDLG